MLFDCLTRKLSTILSILLLSLARSWETMSDAGISGIRWGFGPRVAIADEEAALDTTPLFQSETSFRDDEDAGNHPRVTIVDHDDFIPPHPVYSAIAEAPIIYSSSLPAVIPSSGPMQSVLQSFRLSNLYCSLDRFLPYTENDRYSAQMASQAGEGAHASPSHILAPILRDLQKLKALTPESLPPYNPNSNVKSHAQVLKEKLLPIGKFIADYLEEVPEAKRGNSELRICRYIADEYWPLPVDDFAYLKIQEKYRNALFKIATSGVPAAGPPPGNSSSNRPLTGSLPMVGSGPDRKQPHQNRV
jgi:hypothetical protein